MTLEVLFILYNNYDLRVKLERSSDSKVYLIPIWRQLESWGAKHKDLLK